LQPDFPPNDWHGYRGQVIIANHQEDILHRLTDAARFALQCGEQRHRELTLALILIVFVCTIAGVGLVDDNYKLLTTIGALIVSIVAGIAFGRNPEKLFGKHLERVARTAFERRAQELHIRTEYPEFLVDLTRGRVTRIPPPSV